MFLGHFLGAVQPPALNRSTLDLISLFHQKNAMSSLLFKQARPKFQRIITLLSCISTFLPFYPFILFILLFFCHFSDVYSRLLSRENREMRLEAEMVDMDVDIAKPLAGETMECLGAAVCYITIYALDTIHLNYLHYIYIHVYSVYIYMCICICICICTCICICSCSTPPLTVYISLHTGLCS